MVNVTLVLVISFVYTTVYGDVPPVMAKLILVLPPAQIDVLPEITDEVGPVVTVT